MSFGTRGLALMLAAPLIALLGACASGPKLDGVVPDLAREQRWLQEFEPSVLVGDVVKLRTEAGRPFAAIHTRAGGPRKKGALILAHGMGIHPDHTLIGELRTRLAERGWETLSIQMPVLAADADPKLYPAIFPEGAARLEAALLYLRGKGERSVGLVSHSMGSRMSLAWIAAKPDTGLAAWANVAIATGEIDALPRVRFPVLDIYAERDFPQVLSGAAARAAKIKGIIGSHQAMLYGADHYFGRKESELAALLDSLLWTAVRLR